MNPEARSRFVKEEANRAGFSFCGISKAEKLEEEASKLEQWLNSGYHGKMGYMQNHFDKRLDPTLLVPGSKSVISLLYNYFPAQDDTPENARIAKYARGTDYHFVLKRKLKSLVNELQQALGDFNARVFVDSAPVMERQWAARSGLGWIGKHTLLINKTMGSYFFIAEIISDLELVPDSPVPDYCGTCTRCIDACPTDAIGEGYLNASKCISYLNIELKEAIPESFAGKMEGWAFGCDICQEVCPWNRFAKPHAEPEFAANDPVSSEEWLEMTDEVFQKLFRRSPLKRKGLRGIQQTIEFLKNKKAP